MAARLHGAGVQIGLVVGVGVEVGVGVNEGVGVGVRVGEGDGVCDGVGVGVRVGEGDGVGLGVGVPQGTLMNRESMRQPVPATLESEAIRNRNLIDCPLTFDPRFAVEVM